MQSVVYIVKQYVKLGVRVGGNMRLLPRLLRPVPEPHGVYVRPGPVDHRFLADFLTEATPATLRGVVFDARLDVLQADLRAEVQARGVESVVDLRATRHP